MKTSEYGASHGISPIYTFPYHVLLILRTAPSLLRRTRSRSHLPMFIVIESYTKYDCYHSTFIYESWLFSGNSIRKVVGNSYTKDGCYQLVHQPDSVYDIRLFFINFWCDEYHQSILSILYQKRKLFIYHFPKMTYPTFFHMRHNVPLFGTL